MSNVSKKIRTIREIKEWTRSILWGAIFVFFFTSYLFKAYRVEGTSMQPLLQNGERIFVNRIIYKLDDIQRGNVVVFYYPAKPSDFFIKRVLGLPGEKIQVRNGEVLIEKTYIDDAGQRRMKWKAVDSHFVPDYFLSHENVKPLIIPQGYYFVAGDHRNKSYDSRLWAMDRKQSPFVPEKYIIGKASFRYWPPNVFGTIDPDFQPFDKTDIH